jgi:hypothetical protein
MGVQQTGYRASHRPARTERTHTTKKKIASLLVFALLLTLSAAALSIGEISTPTLSEMSDQELIAFLAANDVSVPQELAENPHFPTVLRNLVAAVEENPYTPLDYSYTVMQAFAETVQIAVNTYYNVPASASPMALTRDFATEAAQLVQSTPLAQNWSTTYNNQNCYGYAIGRTVRVDPGYYYNQTMPDGNGFNFTLTLSIDAMASTVAMDLEALGNEVEIHNTRPSYSSIDPDETLICIRKDETSNIDYHFMRYSTIDGKWKHKPGSSVPLQYEGTMSNSVDWLHEGIFESGYRSWGFYYDSNIRYIIYRDPDYYNEENNSTPDIPEVNVVS